MSELMVVAVLFVLSLAAAWILFKVLKSTAAVTRREYQLGGAAAGFLIIYSALYFSYQQLAGMNLNDEKAKLSACETKVMDDERELPIKGTVSPVLRNATIVLAVNSINLSDDGRFGLSARGVDPKKDPISIYVIGEKEYGYYQLFPEDDTSHLKIDMTQAVEKK